MRFKAAIYLFSMTVGTHRFTHVPAALYDAAPDSGRVRLYFRIGDRVAVNFEVLPTT